MRPRSALSTAVLGALLPLLSAPPAGALEAAAGKADITPDLATERTFLAGFGATGREPAGVHDPLHARVVVLREKDAGGKETTIALVSLDLLGWSMLDTERVRRGWMGEGRRLLIHATHQHSGPDTLGLWGPRIGASGLNPKYQERVSRAIVAAIEDAEKRLRPAVLSAGAGTLDPRGLCRDSRDPQVIDPFLSVLRVKGTDGKAVATVVNWSCHPEVIGRENRLITADFPGPLCARIEEKTGGGCVFLNGMIGGLMTPDVTEETFEETARVGRTVADAALALPAKASGGRLGWRAETILVPVENSRYLLFLGALTAGHDLLKADGSPFGSPRLASLRHLLFGTKDADRPWVRSEVSVLDVGPVRLLGLPAEIFPELAIGGYDGKYAFGRPVVDPKGVPRELAAAPKGPYLRDLVKAPVAMLVGLADDELGYVMPEYDFKIRTSKSMLPRLPGHYEETNSIGRSAARIVTEAAAKLLAEPRK